MLGALCALWTDKVLISNLWLAVIFLAANNYIYTPAFAPLFLLFTCYFVLCFGFSRALSAIHLPGDYSYGLYIYGWPSQQLMAMWFPHWSASLNVVSSLVFAMILAALSWHLVEKPSLAQKAAIKRVPPKQWKTLVAVAGRMRCGHSARCRFIRTKARGKTQAHGRIATGGATGSNRGVRS